jgi:hypothetical protein
LVSNPTANEITAIPKLLDLLDIREGTITIDALGCQTETAKQMRKQQADYIPTVKDNHKNLHEDIRKYFEGLRAAPNPRVKGKKQMSSPKKRFTAAMNPGHMLNVIFRK